MYYPNQLLLMSQKFDQSLIIKESEDFLQLKNSIQLKAIHVCQSILKGFTFIPQLFDFLSYLLLRIQTI